MNILIVGCGRVGIRLAQSMEYLGHDVAVVEENTLYLERLAEGTPPFTGLMVRGVPIDEDILRSAGIENCDAVATVTQDDNVNLMVAQMALEVFHVKNVIARVTDPYTKEIYSEQFGMRTVCGTNLTAQAFVAGLLLRQDEETIRRVSFGSSTANLSAVPVTAEQIGMKVYEAPCPRAGMLHFGIWRANGTMELAANPQPVLRKGDSIIFAQIAD